MFVVVVVVVFPTRYGHFTEFSFCVLIDLLYLGRCPKPTGPLLEGVVVVCRPPCAVYRVVTGFSLAVCSTRRLLAACCAVCRRPVAWKLHHLLALDPLFFRPSFPHRFGNPRARFFWFGVVYFSAAGPPFRASSLRSPTSDPCSVCALRPFRRECRDYPIDLFWSPLSCHRNPTWPLASAGSSVVDLAFHSGVVRLKNRFKKRAEWGKNNSVLSRADPPPHTHTLEPTLLPPLGVLSKTRRIRRRRKCLIKREMPTQ